MGSQKCTAAAGGSTCKGAGAKITCRDRKSTRLNSSHLVISYAVFCLEKKKKHSILMSRVGHMIDLYSDFPCTTSVRTRIYMCQSSVLKAVRVRMIVSTCCLVALRRK